MSDPTDQRALSSGASRNRRALAVTPAISATASDWMRTANTSALTANPR